MKCPKCGFEIADEDHQWNIMQKFLDAIRKNSHNIDSILKRIDELEKVKRN